MNNRANVSASDFALTQKLKERRERLNLTQTDVAKLMTNAGLRLSQTAMSRIEKGERAFTVGEAQLYAEVLHTSLEELLRADGVDELVADSRATIRAMEITRDSAIRSLNEHWEQIRKLRGILDRARDLGQESSLTDLQREKLDEQLFKYLYAELPHYDDNAELRIARALDALELSTINESIITAEDGHYNL